MLATRMDALRTLSVISALLLCPLMTNAQVTPPADAMAATAPAPTVAPAPEPPAVTQPFVGTVTADKVYVRSGPGSAYYELGQLSKGDTVQVVGSRQGWYQILPPNGTYCMVAKEFVETDASAQAGTVKADYVNVRAGTALNRNREPSAVLCVIRKGAKLTILGSTDKYYEVSPPEKAYVFISPQLVKLAPGTDYRVPDLKLTPGAVGPSRATVTAPTTLPTATVEVSPTPAPTEPRPPAVAETQPAIPPVPLPAPAFSADAYKRFDELNTRYQAELQKPVGKRDGLDSLIKDYKDLLAGKEPMPRSVKLGSEARLADLEKLATIQRLQKESVTSAEALAAQRKALQEQYASAERALDEYERSGPYVAEGTLKTSTAVVGKYALVNPTTGRTVGYVDPQSEIDIGSLLDKYIGVRGTTKKAEGTDITVIHVKNATLLPAPVVPKPTAP